MQKKFPGNKAESSAYESWTIKKEAVNTRFKASLKFE